MNVSSLPLMFRSIRRTTNLRRWRDEAPVREICEPYALVVWSGIGANLCGW
jgi:hypothetical protein